MQENQIVVDDCLNHLKSIQDNTFDITFTSPPYGFNAKQDNNSHKKYINSETILKKDWLDWQIKVIDECLRVSKKYVIYNIGAIKENRENVYRLIGYYADKIHDDMIWYKVNGQPSATPNVIECFVNSNNPYSDIHGAMMPQKLSDIIIANLTFKGDFVLDPFSGLGTTAISCIKYGRKFYGIEIYEQYAKVSLERIKDAQVEKNSEFNFEMF